MYCYPSTAPITSTVLLTVDTPFYSHVLKETYRIRIYPLLKIFCPLKYWKSGKMCSCLSLSSFVSRRNTDGTNAERRSNSAIMAFPLLTIFSIVCPHVFSSARKSILLVAHAITSLSCDQTLNASLVGFNLENKH